MTCQPGNRIALQQSTVLTICAWIAMAVCGSSVQADIWSLLNPELVSLRREQLQLAEQLQVFGRMAIGPTAEQLGAQFHMAAKKPTAAPWIQIDLEEIQAFDSVTIVPAITRVESGEISSYAFPGAFRVDASDDSEFANFEPLLELSETTLEARHGLPVVVRTPGVHARYIRVTVTSLAEVAERWTFAFGEIIVLCGDENIAANKQVAMKVSPRIPPKWHPEFLTDERTPLGPPIEIELPEFDGVYSAPMNADDPNYMMVDLGESLAIDRITLHPIDARQGAALPGYAFPRRIRIDTAITEDFRDVTEVFDSGNKPFANPGSNPVNFRFLRRQARYVRATCLEPSLDHRGRFGLSELQVFCRGKNVAEGAKVIIPSADRYAPELLVDGYASYGRLLQLSDWIDRWDSFRQLHLDLAATTEAICAAEKMAEERGMKAATMGGISGVLILAAWGMNRRHQQRKEQTRFRRRLAQDLHDEIGSNLAAIARLGEVAQLETTDGQQSADWDSVRRLALECTDSMRETLWLLGAEGHAAGRLPEKLKTAAERMLPGIELHWQQADRLPEFSQHHDFARQVFLAFKEILANIARHSEASQVDVLLGQEAGRFLLSVRDDGCGFCEKESRGMGLSNIRHRIAKLGGTIGVRSAPGNGTQIDLSIPIETNSI